MEQGSSLKELNGTPLKLYNSLKWIKENIIRKNNQDITNTITSLD